MQVKSLILNKEEVLNYGIVLPVVAFTIPFFASGPQLLTGTLVNSFLILTAIKLPLRKAWPVIVFPSIGALGNGILFGPYTPFLTYFLPFIWLGNFILVKSFIEIKKNTSFPLALFLSSLLKAALLFVFAFAYFKLNLVPQIFLTAMSIFQFLTAIAGGTLTFGLLKALNRND
ncbi:MAG: hypothetical protein COX78_04140 [Candidatus Levybacteria bacterium CG_4_10_14_0_2_um_filter_35_8]|nr:MAG: hypothetical protein COX78_04140 [Candidatus Levybacteria bacterium CG_4_10_14_0_2_um_filter_35_8]